MSDVITTEDLKQLASKRLRTIVFIILEYNGREYYLEHDFGHSLWVGAIHAFHKGNLACDCKKALLIQQHCDTNFPELDCGDKIKIKNFDVKRSRAIGCSTLN